MTTKNYLDLNSLDSDRVVEYTKKIGDDNGYTEDKIFGLLSNNNNQYHKYCGFNKFTVETYPVPLKNDGWDGWLDDDILMREYNRFYIDILYPNPSGPECTFDEFVNQVIKDHKKEIKTSVCDPTSRVFNLQTVCPIDQYKDNQNFNVYKTLDNGLVGFFVVIGKNEVNDNNVAFIYGRTSDVIPGSNLFNKISICSDCSFGIGICIFFK